MKLAVGKTIDSTMLTYDEVQSHDCTCSVQIREPLSHVVLHEHSAKGVALQSLESFPLYKKYTYSGAL